MGHVRVRDKGFVCRVVQKDRAVPPRVGDPFFQFFPRNAHARRIVRKAQVDHVGPAAGNLRQKTVLPPAGHIDDIAESGAFPVVSGAASHHVGVDINGINRVADRDDVVRAEDIADIAGVALRAVADENLVRGNLDAAVPELVFADGLPQERVAGFRPIAAERLGTPHLPRSGGHRLHNGRGQRPGDVADSQPEDFRLGMFSGKIPDAVGDFHEQIVGRKFCKVLVDFQQILHIPFLSDSKNRIPNVYYIRFRPSRQRQIQPAPS